MQFLTDILGTRYAYSALSMYINKKLTEIPDGETIDVTRVKFGPGAFAIVINHMQRLNFINSGDKELDKTLKEIQAAERDNRDPNVELPVINSYEDIVAFVKNIPEGLKYYKFKVDVSVKAQHAIIALVLARPDLEIDISNRYIETFAVLDGLGAPKGGARFYVQMDSPRYLQNTQPNGNSVSAPMRFGLDKPIDLENPDPNHFFYKVIKNMQKAYEEPVYVSFVEAAKNL